MDVLEIKTEKELKAWFEEYPPAVAQVVAARAALRLLPYVIEDKDKKNFASNTVLPVFQAVTRSWVASKYGVHPTETVDAPVTFFGDPVFIAALHAFSAFTSTTSISYQAASACAVVFSRAPHAAPRVAAFWKECLQDCSFLKDAIEQGGEAENVAPDLAGQPLWRTQSMPAETLERWNALKDFFSDAGINWQGWRYWYQARLDGGKTIDVPSDLLETLDVGIATLDEEFWKQGPTGVNFEISRLRYRTSEAAREREAASPEEIDDAGDDLESIANKLHQDAAAYRFVSDKGPIDAVPFRSPVDEKAFAETTLLEARTKVAQLIETMMRSNSDRGAISSAQTIAEVLQADVSDVNAALLRSKTRTLEAIGIAYAASGSEAEIFAGAVAEILDATGTLKDLQACYPALRNIEKNAAALEIAGREEAFEKEIRELGGMSQRLSEQTEGVLTENTVEALNAHNSDIDNAPTKEVKSELLASALLVARNFLSAAYQKILSPVGLEALRVGKKHYHALIDGSVVGTKIMGKEGPRVFLAYLLGGEILAAAAIISSNKSLKDARELVQKKLDDKSDEDEAVDEENYAADDITEA